MLKRMRRLPLSAGVAAMALPLIPFVPVLVFLATRPKVPWRLHGVDPTQFHASLYGVFLHSLFASIFLAGLLLLLEAYSQRRATRPWKRALWWAVIGAAAVALIVAGYVGYSRIDALYLPGEWPWK